MLWARATDDFFDDFFLAMMQALTVILLAAAVASASAGGGGPAVEFGEDVAATFTAAVSKEDVFAEVKASGKPGVVFVTQPWCVVSAGLPVQARHRRPLLAGHRRLPGTAVAPLLYLLGCCLRLNTRRSPHCSAALGAARARA